MFYFVYNQKKLNVSSKAFVYLLITSEALQSMYIFGSARMGTSYRKLIEILFHPSSKGTQ